MMARFSNPRSLMPMMDINEVIRAYELLNTYGSSRLFDQGNVLVAQTVRNIDTEILLRVGL